MAANPPIPLHTTRAGVGIELQYEIEQFLYWEAQLLDERRFEEWYALLADDIHYWMPTRTNRLRREHAREFSQPDQLALFDEDKRSLAQRLKRLETGMAWAEEPPSRTRHLVTNIRIRPGEEQEEYEVHCNYILYRSRLEREQDTLVGTRQDILRKVTTPAGWEIARRTIILDQTVLLAKNLSIFF